MGSKTIKAPTSDELLNELYQRFGEPTIPPGAVNLKMVQKKLGKSWSYCYRLMEREYELGTYKKVKVGGTFWYYPPESE